MKLTFAEEIEGRTMWPRSRAWPGEDGLMWHMQENNDRNSVMGDLGLLVADESTIVALALSLTKMRIARGMVSEVRMVQITGGEE